jgi:hypothetical protein
VRTHWRTGPRAGAAARYGIAARGRIGIVAPARAALFACGAGYAATCALESPGVVVFVATLFVLVIEVLQVGLSGLPVISGRQLQEVLAYAKVIRNCRVFVGANRQEVR